MVAYRAIVETPQRNSEPIMFPDGGTSGIAHAIQLALAPVFLLTAISALLAMMTSRLARIVDRARFLESRVAEGSEAVENQRAELALIAQRARLVSWSIALCTAAALLVAALVAILFLGASYGFRAGIPIAVVFILSMLGLICALSLYLREVFISTRTLRFAGSTLRELSRGSGLRRPEP